MECHYAVTSNKGNLSPETAYLLVSDCGGGLCDGQDYIHEH